LALALGLVPDLEEHGVEASDLFVLVRAVTLALIVHNHLLAWASVGASAATRVSAPNLRRVTGFLLLANAVAVVVESTEMKKLNQSLLRVTFALTSV
jgi:hypothetical protein